MRNTSATYKTLRSQTGSFYEVEVIRGNTTYDMDDLMSININPKLFEGDGPSIGNAISSVCYMKLIEFSSNWPRMAEFSIRIRLSSADGLTTSEWLNMGTYYTDVRQENKNGVLEITAYDGMLLTEQYWTDKIDPNDMPSVWPITSKAWIDLVEDIDMIEVDSRTTIDNTVALIGLDTQSTVRDVLKTIAAAHGSNWIMTPEGKIRLVPFVNSNIAQSAIAGIAIAGIAVVGSEGSSLPAGIGTDNLAFNVQTFEDSPALAGITGVHLETATGVSTEAGTDSGYVLDGVCNFSSSTGVAALCLTKVSGYSYRPFSGNVATLDPAAEPGDIVIVAGESYQVMDIDWNLNKWPTANIAAAFEQEVDHEYEVLDASAKTLRKAIAETDRKLLDYSTTVETESMIAQSAESIEFRVAENYYNKDEISDFQQQNEANFTLTSQQIQAALSQISTLNGQVEDINYYIRYQVIGGVGTVIVGQTNSYAELYITNNQISLMYNGAVISYWNQNKQYTPTRLEIPSGGSLRIGNLLVQPRSSGNVSVMWLGES